MPTKLVVLMLGAALAMSTSAAAAPSDGPFQEMIIERPPPRSHTWSYVSLATGAALVGASFALANHADDAYGEYLASSDPSRLDGLFDEAVRYDRLSSGSLFVGEALVAFGLYLRFLRPPRTSRVSFALDSHRCALVLRL